MKKKIRIGEAQMIWINVDTVRKSTALILELFLSPSSTPLDFSFPYPQMNVL